MFPDFSQTSADHRVAGVQLQRPLIRVDRVRHLIVTRFIQCTEIEPNFSEVRVNTYRARVGVQSVVELIDVVVQHANRAPKGWIFAVTVHGLLISLVRLAKVARGHVRSSEQVPRERIVCIRFQ